jgi:hypothetical protein
MTEKNRDIPLSEFYYNLQIEYLSYFLRSKIYCKPFSENYFKICEAKKEKIERISVKNNLPSIFNSDFSKNKFLERFMVEWGPPNFAYKDEEIQFKMQCWDRHYFFSKGVSVKFILDGKVLTASIWGNDKQNEIVTVIDENGVNRDLHYNNVSRIIPEDFFNF